MLTTLLVAAGLAAASVAYAKLTQTPVITGPQDQSLVTAQGSVIAWSQNSSTNSGPFNLYVRSGGAVRRVNPAGTQGFPGPVSGDRLLFQQVTNSQSDLRFYNLISHVYGAVPSGWNTKSWEWRPRISGHYVLFGRKTFTTNRYVILLGDLTTGSLKLLAASTGTDTEEEPGQINGNYATWTYCSNIHTHCDVYEYNIATGNTSKVSNTFASGQFQYAASVSSTGTVFFVHSGLGCGVAASLNERPLGASRTTLVSLANGTDMDNTYLDDSSATPVLYYTPYHCSSQQADVYKIVNP